MSDILWQRRECVSAEVEDSLVLLDLETLVYHSLNATAAAIWEALTEPRSDDSLVADLCSRYEVEPDRCRHSVERILAEFATHNLVKPAAVATARSARS